MTNPNFFKEYLYVMFIFLRAALFGFGLNIKILVNNALKQCLVSLPCSFQLFTVKPIEWGLVFFFLGLCSPYLSQQILHANNINFTGGFPSDHEREDLWPFTTYRKFMGNISLGCLLPAGVRAPNTIANNATYHYPHQTIYTPEREETTKHKRLELFLSLLVRSCLSAAACMICLALRRRWVHQHDNTWL